MKNIKTLYPEAKITLVCRQGLGDVFKTWSLVDQVLEIQKKDRKSYQSVVSRLRAESVDWLFCPHKSFRSGLLAWQISASKGKVSFRQWWNFWIFSKSMEYPKHLPDALRQLSLLALINREFQLQLEMALKNPSLKNSSIKNENVDFRKVNIPDWAAMAIEGIGQKERENTVVLAPGSVWNTKKWTESGYRELAVKLVSQGINVVLMGSQAEHSICERIREKVPKCVNMAGQTNLEGSLKLLGRSRLLVSNDSGAMHLAATAGTPTVAIFGPTTLEIGYRPWNQQAIVVQKALKCRPCGKHGHKECPLGTHECMTSITSEEVMSACRNFL